MDDFFALNFSALPKRDGRKNKKYDELTVGDYNVSFTEFFWFFPRISNFHRIYQLCIFRAFSNFVVDLFYFLRAQVQKFYFRTFPYGKKIVADIKDFYVVLPDRYSNRFTTEAQLDSLNRTPVAMCYRGKEPGQFGMLKIDFRPQHNGQSFEDEAQIPSDDDEPVVPVNIGSDDDDVVETVLVGTTTGATAAVVTTEVAATKRGKRSADDNTQNTYVGKRAR